MKLIPYMAVALLAVSAACSGAPRWRAVLSPAGAIHLAHDGHDIGDLEPGLFGENWQGGQFAAVKIGASAEESVLHGKIQLLGNTVVDTELQTESVPNGLRLRYRLTPKQTLRLNSLHISLSFPASVATGGTFTADDKHAEFPAQLGSPSLHAADTHSLELAFANDANLAFRFADGTHVLVQDDRQWNDTFTVRIGLQMSPAREFAAGKPYEIEFTLTAPGGIAVVKDGPVTIEAGPDWIPLDTQLDIKAGSALDFSHLVPWHTPAGKLGRVIAGKHGQMVFAKQPQKPVRFYGVNLCFTGQYLSHEQADRLAERLHRLGYNAVRLHHYEGPLVDRSHYTSTTLKPNELDQLDYLFAALKRRGIYITTDLFVSRTIFAAEIWPGETDDVGMDEFKMAVPVNERAFANYRSFATALLNHMNPYTHMRWADDPTLAWLSLINEPNPGNFIGSMTPRLRADYERAWKKWLQVNRPQQTDLAMPVSNDGSQTWILMNVFLAENQRAFVERARHMLRNDLKCNAMITNWNAWTNPIQMEAIRPELDYVDDHFYVDHPSFLEHPWQLPTRCPNTSPVAQGAQGGRSLAFTRLLDRPFTCTEYNYAGPGRFRGVGGILTGALGAVQNWSAIWKFAYSHSRENEFTPSPAGYFDTATDPLSQAADRASLCLFCRGDMSPAAHAAAITFTPDDALKTPRSTRGIVPAWQGLAWVTRVGTQVLQGSARPASDLAYPLGSAAPGSPSDPYSAETGKTILQTMHAKGWLKSSNPTDLKLSRFQSENGELTIDAPSDTMTLDTARTAGGYAPAGSMVRTKTVTIKVMDTGATVWVSSLDGKPIATSKHLLITHLTDLQNSGAHYADMARTIITAWGGMPHLVRRGRATVTVRIAHASNARVWALATSGDRTAEVPTRAQGGALAVSLDTDGGGKARMMYEVQLP